MLKMDLNQINGPNTDPDPKNCPILIFCSIRNQDLCIINSITLDEEGSGVWDCTAVSDFTETCGDKVSNIITGQKFIWKVEGIQA